jgi:hypothetical protein
MVATLLILGRALAVAVASAAAAPPAGVAVVDCASAAAAPWALDVASSALTLVVGGSKLCMEPGAPPPAHDPLVLEPCPARPTPWEATDAPGFAALVIKGRPGAWGPAALMGEVALGHPTILYSLLSAKGYCASHHSCDFVFNATTGKIVNPETQLCLGAGPSPKPPAPGPPPSPPSPPHPRPPRPASPPPNLAYTCEAGQPLAGTPTCDRSLGFKARAADLASRLNISDHIDLFFSYPGTPYIPALNIKSWSLDHTCIHGLNKARNITLFPHEIAQGASWDPSLVERILNATATEARIMSAKGFVATHGHSLGEVLSCDGGPSAAQAHDPRWGRVSWTWGEDAFHIGVMGQAAYVGLQSPRPVPGGKPTDRFLATRATVPYLPPLQLRVNTSASCGMVTGFIIRFDCALTVRRD